MKKRWKIFWIVCAVLAASGLLLAAAGAALGGLSALRNAGKPERLTGKDFDTMDPDEYSGPQDGELIMFDYIEDIDLNLGGLQVYVIPGNVDGVGIDTSYLRSDIREKVESSIEYEEEDYELKVDIGKRLRGWSTEDTGTLYIVYSPWTQFGSFSAEMSAGLLELHGLWADEVSLSVGAGQITAQFFETEHLDTECGAGSIELLGAVLTGDAEIDCKLGSIVLIMANQAAESDYDYELSCGAGEVIVGNKSYSGLFREVEIDNGSSRLIKADCGLGSIAIQFE